MQTQQVTHNQTRMSITCISLLLLSLGFTLLNVSEAGQAEQLRRLIQSTKPSSSPARSRPWFNLGAATAASSPSPPVHSRPQIGLMADDKIAALPGQPEGVNFDQYAGYVTVNGETGRALFYYFVESPYNSSTNPLVLWLNGGPGCSSLGYGAMEELGPFRVKSDGKTLEANPFAWNNLANVIFLESPAGVGFSYSNTTSDYDESGDARTAQDAYTFLINWLERFPQYKGREFFITGESYGGHYIPQLAALILERNSLGNNTLINLKAVAIGNAYVDDASNSEGTDEFLTSHAIISPDGSSDMGRIDPYNIYAPVCVGSNSTVKSGVAMADVDPCSDDYVHAYLNNPDVQKAMHARTTDWEACITLPWNDRPASTIPVIEKLIGGGLIKVWLYSGDTDSVCPYQGTMKAIKIMKLSVTDSWRPWYSQQQVGGYVTGYGQLTLVTVRGAGHLVPTYQPERALTMLSAFLNGMLPPAY